MNPDPLRQEVYTFTQYINNNLKRNRHVAKILPMDPNSDELFDQLWTTKGLLFQQLIFLAADNPKSLKHHFEQFKIPEKDNVFQMLSNIEMCLSAAKGLVKIIGISQENFQHRDRKLVLGVVWQLIRRCLIKKVESV